MNPIRPTRRSVLLTAAAGLLNVRRTWAQSTALKIGVAEIPITPSWPTTLWGYDNNTHYTSGVLDDIWAKAFLFDSGKRFLWISLDAGAIGFDFTRRVCRRIQTDAKIPADAISIQVTHDHSAPALLSIPSTPADERFQALLEDKLAELAKEAVRNLTDATLDFGQIDSFIGLNRRVGNRANTWDKDSGPIDPKFSIILARSTGGRNLGVIVNYPSHPVTLREDNDKISADFPGVMCKELGGSIKCPVMFSQACAGDVIPKVFGSPKEMTEYGKKMADEARHALSAARPLTNPTVDCASRRVLMTFIAPVPLDQFRTNYSQYFRTSTHYLRQWAERYLRYLEDGGDLRQSRDSIVEALSLGDVVVAFPGEILHLTGLLIREQFPGRKLIVAAYSNDTSVGYLPHADEFPKGKYEVEDAWKYYGTLRTTPQMERDVRETAIDLLRILGSKA